MTTPKEYAAAVARVRLTAFLASGAGLDLTPAGPPRVTVVILMRDRAEVTLACLQSLALRLNRTPVELVLVDNASIDATADLLARVAGAKVLRNPVNAGFPAGVNRAAAVAAGEYLLLLNNDTEVVGRGIDAAVACLDAEPDVAVVGGRVVLLDGTLQEAGCLLWRDGWPHQYGRSAAPDDPAVRFARDVDYCSAACVLVRRSAFDAFGGMDESFGPGYFEDVDFAVRVRRAGWRVAYRPDLVTLHYESLTSAAIPDQTGVLNRNHRAFVGRHAGWLAGQLPRTGPNALLGRRADDPAAPVLVLPSPADPVGAVARVTRAVERAGGMPTVGWPGGPVAADAARAGLPPTCEVMPTATAADLAALLAARPAYFSLALTAPDAAADVAETLAAAGVERATGDGAGYRFG